MPFNRKLTFGVYDTTSTFKNIKQHSCVCFADDMGLVAVTGPARDKESQKYAEFFAATPDMLEALEMLVKSAYKAANADHYAAFTPEELAIANAAIAKAKGLAHA